MDPIQERNLVICKICNKLKFKITVQKYENNQKKYTDENGLMWNGKNCPTCHQQIVKERKNGRKNI